MSSNTTLKVVFASDLHGSLGAAKQLIEIVEQQQASWLVLLGDLLNHGPRNTIPNDYEPVKVAELLNKYAERIIAVQGNCDSEVDQMLLGFPLLVPWQNLVINQTRFFLTHGHHYSPSDLPSLKTTDVFVYGHTHIPQLSFVEGICCFNPGSTTFPKNGSIASYGLFEGKSLSIYPLNSTEAKHRLTSLVLPEI